MYKIRSLEKYKLTVYYAILCILLVSLILGVIASRGIFPKRTYSTVGNISNITEIKAYQANGSSGEVLINKVEGKLIMECNPAANVIHIYVSQTVLDSEPDFVLLNLGVYGVSDDFTYTIIIERAGFVEETGFTYVPGDIFVFKSNSEGQLSKQKLLIHDLKSVERKGNPLDDCILFCRSDYDASVVHANDIKRVEVGDLAFVKEEEGRETVQSILLDYKYTLLVSYIIVLLFILPIMFLKLKKPSKLLIIIMAGFLVRILMAPLTSYAYDVQIWKYAGRKFYEEGEIALFTNWTSPPFWYFTIILSYLPYMLLRNMGLPDARIYYQPILSLEVTFIKLPLILSDILSALLIHKICRERNLGDKTSKVAASVYLFNPFSIHVSSIWPMFDSLAIFFALLGFYLCMKKRFYLSSLIWGFAVKWYTLAFVPFLSILAYLQNNEERTLTRLLKSTLIMFIGFGFFAFQMTLPYLMHGDVTSLGQIMHFRLGTGGDPRLVDFEGVTFWKFFHDAGLRLIPNFFLLTFAPLYLISLIMFFVYSRKLALRGNDTLPTLCNALIAIMLTFYLTYPQMNPQNILWILPFLILGHYMFNQVGVLPIMIVSLLSVNILGDFAYYTIGSSISGISMAGTPITSLSSTVSSLFIPIALYFILKLFPSSSLKVSTLCKNFFDGFHLYDLYVFYFSTIVLIVLQTIIVYTSNLYSTYLLPLLSLTIFLQSMLFFSIESERRFEVKKCVR